MAQVPVRPAPRGFDVDIDDAVVTLRSSRLMGILKNAMWELWMNRMATVGAVMIFMLFLVAVLAPQIARYDPVKQNYREMLQGPSAAHYFGTDKFGRDIWSRTVWGCQRLVLIAVLAVLVGLLGGVPLGAISGYYGGRLDQVLMRVVDAWLAFPGLIFYLLAATLVRAYELSLFWNTVGLILALGTARIPSMARLVRGTVLAEREKDYVEASVAMGEAKLYIAFRQILPNCLSPVIVQATIALGFELLIIASLAFLGLGAPPPTPDWGADLNLAREHMETRPYLAIFPGLAISFAVLAFNLFGDGLRDILDPRTADR
ncbi:MAG TPA: ABC transporter permease [Candidatus Tectomicrobia bacterium]|jgi:peptide/nickel transport system permease protein